jgi:hypothetical protein
MQDFDTSIRRYLSDMQGQAQRGACPLHRNLIRAASRSEPVPQSPQNAFPFGRSLTLLPTAFHPRPVHRLNTARASARTVVVMIVPIRRRSSHPVPPRSSQTSFRSTGRKPSSDRRTKNPPDLGLPTVCKFLLFRDLKFLAQCVRNRRSAIEELEGPREERPVCPCSMNIRGHRCRHQNYP